MYVCVFLYVCVCVCLRLRERERVFICVCVCVYLCVCGVCVCVFLSLCVVLPSYSRRGLPSERAPFCLQSDLRLSGSRGTCTQQSLPARRANTSVHTHTHTLYPPLP